MVYKIYVTDALKVISENGNKALNVRFIDLLAQQKKTKDNRSGAEIAADVIKGCGLVVKDNKPI